MPKFVILLTSVIVLVLSFQNCGSNPQVSFESVPLKTDMPSDLVDFDHDENYMDDYEDHQDYSEYEDYQDHEPIENDDQGQEQTYNPPPSPPQDPGVYEGYITYPRERRFIRTEGISYEEALANCEENARLNPDDGIYCTYNGELIFKASEPSHSPPPSPPPSSGSGTYIGYFMTPSPRMFIKTVGISKAEALANCKLNARNNPSYQVKCTYDGRVIYTSQGNSSSSYANSVYEGYLGSHRFIRTVGISRAEALANCKQNAALNPGSHITCTYNGVKIYESK